MAEKLIDPSLDKFHLFGEEEGMIRRNDGRAFRPADKNPWYVLATVFGGDGEKKIGGHGMDVPVWIWTMMRAKSWRMNGNWMLRN